MPTPGYAIKHWWRNTRHAGESLKAFALRHAGSVLMTTTTQERISTALRWIRNKKHGRTEEPPNQ